MTQKFDGAWDKYGAVWYPKINCYLPNIKHFQRMDDKDWAPSDALFGILHSRGQREDILLCFGPKGTKSHSLQPPPSLLAIWPERDVDACYRAAFDKLLSFDYNEDRHIWWPSEHPDFVERLPLVRDSWKRWLEERKRLEASHSRAWDASQNQMVQIDAAMGILKLNKNLLYATGASIYAQPTKGSSQALNKFLDSQWTKEETQAHLEKRVLYADFGVGSGTFLTTLAVHRSQDMLGIEYDQQRVLIALNNQLAWKAHDTRDIKFEPNIAFVAKNLMAVSNLGIPPHYKVLVLYLGDEAYDNALMMHLANLLQGVAIPVILVSDKAGRHKYYRGFWEEYGFNELGKVRWSKEGGKNEKGSFFIFRRAARCRTFYQEPTAQPGDPEIARALKLCCMGASPASRMAYLHELKSEIESGQYPFELWGPELKRARKPNQASRPDDKAELKRARKPIQASHKPDDKVDDCCSSVTFENCLHTCLTCSSHFRHHPSSVAVMHSPIHGSGLVAVKRIPTSRFIVEYTGVVVDPEVAEDKSYIIEIPGVGFLDAKNSSGKHKFVNHCCDGKIQPNACFRKWVDQTGLSRVSLVAERDIAEDSEIFVNYVGRKVDPCSCPNCRVKIAINCFMVFGNAHTFEDAKKQIVNHSMLLRDTVRCLATEEQCDAKVYSIDKRKPFMPREGRHIDMNLNKINLEHALLKPLKGMVDQITLDWIWFLGSHTRERLGKAFYRESISRLALLLRPGGAIYLPLCPSIFVQIVQVAPLFSGMLQVSLLTETQAQEILLWQGTQVVKDEWDLTHKSSDQLGSLGITERAVKDEAEADPETIVSVAMGRYRQWTKDSVGACFVKLLKIQPSTELKPQATKTPYRAAKFKSRVVDEEFRKDGIVVFDDNRLPSLAEAHVDQLRRFCSDYLSQALHTVRSKDKVEDLKAIGFDRIRFRGEGRYELVPEHGGIERSLPFMTDAQAPWMPAVRAVLGENACSINKGFFVSAPGSITQAYHHDGVHLSKKEHQSAYAVNVFLPLVDMSMQLGPTEFVKGSHILGKEAYKKECAVSPILKAGQFLMFDYRLGQLGLANRDYKTSRPYFYCTYSAKENGKLKFQGKVNFSKRRYRQLGELIHPTTREERRKQKQKW